MPSVPFLVEATGFEPTTSWSRTKRATKLRYASLVSYYIKSIFFWQAFFFIKNPKKDDICLTWRGGVMLSWKRC